MYLIMVRVGEIFLKSPFVFDQMKRRLAYNIRNGLAIQNIKSSVYEDHTKIFIETKNLKKTEKILCHTFGVSSFSVVNKIDSSINKMKAVTKKIAAKWKAGTKFAVRTKRIDKTFRYTSEEVNKKIGRVISKMGFAVDLTNPDKEIFIDISKKTYIYSEKISGPGGLPLKQARLECALRKKEDIIAAWFIMKRGLLPYFSKKSKKDLLRIIEKWAVGKELRLPDKKKKKYMKAIISSETDINKIKALKDKTKKVILTPLVGLNKEYIKNKIKNLELC